jgi:hypothetical protein
MSDSVCGPCLVDECLRKYVSARGAKGCCSFCEGRNRKAMPISAVAQHILECLQADYTIAENVLSWAEGQWVGDTLDTYELLDRLELGCEDDVLSAIAGLAESP